jgi:hypothetical protein
MAARSDGGKPNSEKTLAVLLHYDKRIIRTSRMNRWVVMTGCVLPESQSSSEP